MATTTAIPIPRRNRPISGDNSSNSRSASTSTSASTPTSSRLAQRTQAGSLDPTGFACSLDSSPSSSFSGSPGGKGKARRESLMSEAFSKAEHTVVNIGDSESPRLITCVKASQGFDWNQEIFLPSYADYHFDDLERKQDPVEDIVVTDEEIKNMFPS